jgi:aryl-alcohol dehydrogenase-like predicted oxidoreductase
MALNRTQGISDAPAWVVAKANQYARDHALTPFSVYQGLWNVMDRSFERDIIPMARDEGKTRDTSLNYLCRLLNLSLTGMALAPWGVLASGKIRTDEEEERRRQSGENGRTTLSADWERTESEKKVCKALEEVAKAVGAKSINSG